MFDVQLVGELVDDDVVSGIVGCAAGEDIVPGKDDGTIGPGFAGTAFVGHGDERPMGALDGGGDVGTGIDQDGDDAREIIGGAMEEEHAGHRGDGETDFVGDLKAGAAFETLFGQKDEDVSLELAAVGAGETVVKWHTLTEEAVPIRVEGPGAETTATPVTEEGHG